MSIASVTSTRDEGSAQTRDTSAAPTESRPAQEKSAARERAEAVIGAVAALYANPSGPGRARLAGLRRAAGENLTTARDLGWLYGLFARFGVREYEEETYLLALSLLAFDRRALEAGGAAPGAPGGKGMGTTLFGLWQATKGPSETDKDRAQSPAARRLRLLLDADYDGRTGAGDLPYRLRQTVRLALSRDVSPDWAQLVLDLRDWGWPDKPVQKRWAREFFAGGIGGDGAPSPSATLEPAAPQE